MKLWFYRCSVIAVLALLASSVGLADGYDFIWSGPTSGGIWQDTNWNAGLATGPLGSYSSIPVASVYIGPGNTVTVGVGPINTWAAAGSLTIDATSQLLVPTYVNGQPLFQAGSVVHNAGDIQLGTPSGGGLLETGASIGYGSYQGATIDGGGTITLTNGSRLTVPNYGIGQTDSVELINQTVRGDGQIDETNLIIDAPSKIDANSSTGARLVMNSLAGNGVVTNNGVMQASNGGVLQLGSGHGTGGPIHITQGSGGVIQALNGSTVMLGYDAVDYDGAGSITGGTLATQGSGHIDARNSFLLDGVTNTTALRVLGATCCGGTVGLELTNTINNTGSISLLGGDVVIVGANGATLTGGGTVNLDGHTISAAPLTNVDNKIQGAGTLWNLGTLNNGGLIDSNQSGGTLLVGSAAITNSGTMRATNGATLQLGENHATVAYTGAGGIVQADAGSTVNFWGGTMSGSTTFTGPGSITATGSRLQDFNMTGNLVGSQGMSIGGTLTNAGQLDLYNDVTLAYSTSAPLTFNGAGTTWFHGGINVGGDSEDPALPAVTNNSTLRGSFTLGLGYNHFVNNGTLYAASGDTIYVQGGYGSFGDSYTTNNGTLRVDAGGTMSIGKLSNHDGDSQTLTGGTYSVAGTLKLADEWAPASIVNNAANIILDGPSSQILAWYKLLNSTTDALAGFNNNLVAGSFTIQNGRNFTTAGDFTNAGAINIGTGTTFQVGPTGSLGTYTQTGGTTKVNGTLTAGTLNIAGGTLSGAGTLNAGLLVSGTLSPGNSPGTITVNGNYTQTGTLNIEAAMGLADEVIVNGDVTLGGILDVTPYGTWTGSVDKDFLILSWSGSKSGAFDQIFLPGLNGAWDGYQFSTDWEANGLYLDVTGNGPTSGTPEPATFLLIGAALLLGGYKLRRSR